ncbi:MAG TPA: FMN-binding protein [Ktedonobacterales bacterium]|jgi:uncharacterized protein with FMN-binding domain|nr:FMN-binding protein [Ktedonobacterales bacterium]HEX5572063.1 FMN-binding protein [Ktedonobacterales bacterium]
MRQSVKKVVVAALIVGAFVLYSLTHARSGLGAAPGVGATGGGSPTATTSGAPTGPTSAAFKDGSYTGSVADAQWGYIQVKAVVSGGKLTDVQFLQYPNEREYSVQVNSIADPQLTQEAIQAQSAQVDVVTGATDSSEAFMQSLSDALSQAQA